MEVQEAIDRLQAGGRLFLVEENPYPQPHLVVIVLQGGRYSMIYNDFVFLLTQQIIRLIGPTTFDTFAAEEYALSPNYPE